MKMKAMRSGGSGRFSEAGTGAPDAIDSSQGSVSAAPAPRSKVLRVIALAMPTRLSLSDDGLDRVCPKIAIGDCVTCCFDRETRKKGAGKLFAELSPLRASVSGGRHSEDILGGTETRRDQAGEISIP